MSKVKWGTIGTIIMAIGSGVMALVTELNDSKREKQMEDLIERVDKYLPKLKEEE